MLNHAEEHPLIHPQQIARAPDHTRSCDHSPPWLGLKRPAQYEEFADEPIQQRKSHGIQNHKKKESCVDRHQGRQTAELGNLISMAAILKENRLNKPSSGGVPAR